MHLIVHLTALMKLGELNKEDRTALREASFFLLFLRIGATHRPHYVLKQPLKVEITSSSEIPPDCAVLYPESGGRIFLRNVGTKLPGDMTLQLLDTGAIYISLLMLPNLMGSTVSRTLCVPLKTWRPTIRLHGIEVNVKQSL
jgi:hypothetical protein